MVEGKGGGGGKGGNRRGGEEKEKSGRRKHATRTHRTGAWEAEVQNFHGYSAFAISAINIGAWHEKLGMSLLWGSSRYCHIQGSVNMEILVRSGQSGARNLRSQFPLRGFILGDLGEWISESPHSGSG